MVAITVNQHQTREPNWLAISPRFLSPAFANYFVYTFVLYNHARFQSKTLLPRAIVSILIYIWHNMKLYDIYVNIFLYCQQLQEINIWRFSRTRVWTSAAAIESAMIWSLTSFYNSSGQWAGCNYKMPTSTLLQFTVLRLGQPSKLWNNTLRSTDKTIEFTIGSDLQQHSAIAVSAD